MARQIVMLLAALALLVGSTLRAEQAPPPRSISVSGTAVMKADMARVVGAELGKVLVINEHSSNQRYSSPMSNVSFSHSPPPVDAASDRFVPGAISVQVSVYVTFELQ